MTASRTTPEVTVAARLGRASGVVPRAAIYARCSAQKQADKELSIPAQIDACRAEARRRGWEVVAQFVDEAESARTAKRPRFQDMIADARQKSRPFDFILVWKFSRFARNRVDSVLYKEKLRKAGVRLISINEPIDNTPAGQMLEGVLESVDEFYSAALSEDTVRGMRKNAGLGYHNGGRVPMGYRRRRTGSDISPKAVLEPDPAWVPTVQRIFRLALAGEGACRIASILHEEGLRTIAGTPWKKQTVLGILRNEVYVGTLIWGVKHTGRQSDKLETEVEEPIRLEAAHEALVTREDFDRVQALIATRTPKRIHPRRLASDYLLSGLLHCGHCGAPMIGHTAKSGQVHYYGCQTKMKTGSRACPARLLGQERAEDAVVDALKRLVLTPEHLSELLRLVNEELGAASQEVRAELEALEAQLKSAESKRAKLYRGIEEGLLELEDIAPRLRYWREEIEGLVARRGTLQDRASGPTGIELDEAEVCRYVEALHVLMASSSVATRKAFLRAWVQRIDAEGQELTISYTLPVLPVEAGEEWAAAAADGAAAGAEAGGAEAGGMSMRIEGADEPGLTMRIDGVDEPGLRLQVEWQTPDGSEVRVEGTPSLVGAATGAESALANSNGEVREITLSGRDRKLLDGIFAARERDLRALQGNKRKKADPWYAKVLPMVIYGSRSTFLGKNTTFPSAAAAQIQPPISVFLPRLIHRQRLNFAPAVHRHAERHLKLLAVQNVNLLHKMKHNAPLQRHRQRGKSRPEHLAEVPDLFHRRLDRLPV